VKEEHRAILCFPDLACRQLQVPTGLYKIASHCETAYQISILDERLCGTGIIADLERLIENKPKAICLGISVTSGDQVFSAARLSRHFHGRVPIVWGGPHATLFAASTLALPYVDYVVVGEGEEAFLALLNFLAAGGPEPNSVAGKTSQSTPYNVFANFPNVVDTYYVEYPTPRSYFCRRDGFVRALALETSRGCPHCCAFCHNSAHHAPYRFKPAEVVIQSIDSTRAVHDIDGLVFQEDNFFVNSQRTMAIMEHLTRTPRIGWKANGRVNYFARYLKDRDFMQALTSSGCAVLQFGIESGSQRMLDAIHKDISLEQVIEMNRRLASYPFRLRYNFIVGFPGETAADRKATLSVAAKLHEENPNAEPPFLNIFTPCPGTPLYEQAVALGYHVPETPEDWQKVTWSSADMLPWLSQDERHQLDEISQQFHAQSLYLK
jgi:anaerobic magnesium-protoporphyrin IX monomethyl ester cyclase